MLITDNLPVFRWHQGLSDHFSVLTKKCPVFTMRACTYSPIAQLVEQMTVNHWVPGSSPGRGAKFRLVVLASCALFFRAVSLIVGW